MRGYKGPEEMAVGLFVLLSVCIDSAVCAAHVCTASLPFHVVDAQHDLSCVKSEHT